MTRLPDWEQRLRLVLIDWADVEHSWERTCVDFAADAVEAVSGRDVRPSMPERSVKGVAVCYRRLHVRCLADAVSAVLGDPKPAIRAERGDVVQASHDAALGVCLGDLAAFLKDKGLTMVPMSLVARAWTA